MQATVPAPPSQDRSDKSIVRLAIPGILLALLCLMPFLNKAYTIDDPWFLLEARQILKTPLEPMSFGICWMGTETCLKQAGDLGAGTVQGLMGYLLVPVILAGGAEWMAHLLQIFLACLVIVEMVRLSLRLGFDRRQAVAAGLLVAAVPPFLSMASTAMPDVAALALGLTGIETLLAWKQEERPYQAVVVSLALGLAAYARPHMALLMPLGALWLLDDFEIRKALTQIRRQIWLWLPLLAAACILIAVNVATRDKPLAGARADILVGPENIPRNLYAYLRYLWFPIPLAFVWLATQWRKSPQWIVLAAVLLSLQVLLVSSKGLLLASSIAGAVFSYTAIIHLVYSYWHTRDRVGIILSLWVLIPVAAVAYTHFPIKYMVATLPAVVLIVVRILSVLPKTQAMAAYAVLTLVGAGFSCVLLRADLDFAEYGRRAAAELIAPYVARGEKVWYGGQWGFYWYAQEAGAQISKPGEPGPNPGELLAVGLEEGGGATRARFPKRELIDSRHYDSPHGRTMGFGGGLYSNRSGGSLWVWNPATTNTYELWRIH